VRLKYAFSLVLALSLVGSFGPAQASSLYHMNGQGTVTINGGGLPACLPVVNVPNCPAQNPNNTFSWGNLTVQGLGVLQGANVGGTYTCLSVETNKYESRIYGNTSNYQLTFNFRCTKATTVAGPDHINGWFSNVVDAAVDNLSPAYQRVQSSHPAAPLLAPGAPVFAGYFSAAASNPLPYAIGSTNGDPMICNGGFAPSDPSEGTSIINALFAGACTAVAS
jgi:hypothetical protein